MLQPARGAYIALPFGNSPICWTIGRLTHGLMEQGRFRSDAAVQLITLQQCCRRRRRQQCRLAPPVPVLLLVVLLFCSTVLCPVQACTSIMVGKRASADGSV